MLYDDADLHCQMSAIIAVAIINETCCYLQVAHSQLQIEIKVFFY